MRSRIYHILLWIVSLSILNSSVDVSEFGMAINHDDADHRSGGVDDFDEIESVVEWIIAETSSDQQTGLPDTDQDPQKLVKKAVAFDFSMPVRREQTLTRWQLLQIRKPIAVNDNNKLSDGFTTLFTPPPDSHLS